MTDEELKHGDEILIRAKYMGHARNCFICDIGAYNPLIYVEAKNVVMSLREEKAEIKRLLRSVKGGQND